MLWFDVYDMLCCDMTWYDVMWYDMTWHDLVLCHLIWCDLTRFDMLWYDKIWYNMVWYHVTESDMYDYKPLETVVKDGRNSGRCWVDRGALELGLRSVRAALARFGIDPALCLPCNTFGGLCDRFLEPEALVPWHQRRDSKSCNCNRTLPFCLQNNLPVS